MGTLKALFWREAFSQEDATVVLVDADPSIISSKLHPPRLTAQHVPRPRLVEQLNKHHDRPLTLVCAPAGTGKSTLLSEWLASLDIPCAWVSLDESDSDPTVFVAYVLAAMRSIMPTLPSATRDLLRAHSPPAPEALAASLSNDLDAVDTDFVLVLDDYHLIASHQIDRLLFSLVRHPPRRMHLAIATRAEPPWPLATFRAGGQIAELRYADLRFTDEEAHAFVRQALADTLTEELVAVMLQETEGWAAGLQLMTVAIAGREDNAPQLVRELGARGDIGSYLFDEILDRQTLQMQRRLLQISVLDRFSASLCEAVCDRDADAGEPEHWGRTSFLNSSTSTSLSSDSTSTVSSFVFTISSNAC